MLSILSQFIFGNSSIFRGQQGGGSGSSAWKDKNLYFDLRQSDLELDNGEQLIACFFPIEDVKGNQDELGVLKVTNLRLIWICCDKKRVNLSIGWRTVSLTFEQNLKDSLGLPITSLCVVTKYESTKYEFVFNRMSSSNGLSAFQDNLGALLNLKRSSDKSPRLITHLTPMFTVDPFEVVYKVSQSYKQTYLFRYCRSNINNLILAQSPGSGVRAAEINKLPSEETIDIYMEIIHHESKSLRNTGTLIVTNIRLIWIDELVPIRNLSIPYIKIDSIKLKQSDRIVVNIHDYVATSNQVELRTSKTIEGARKMKVIYDQMQNLYTLYKAKPRFGPESCLDNQIYMSHLRPLENYLESFDESILRAVDKVSQDNSIRSVYPFDTDGFPSGVPLDISKFDEDESTEANIEKTECELNKYNLKFNNYLDEQPIGLDKELMYSKELGLVVERPINNLDIHHIWRIDL